MQLVKNVYHLVKSYLKEEPFALTQQTKRAAVSIPANIAEGIGKNYKKDTIQFLHIARGCLYELVPYCRLKKCLNLFLANVIQY